MQDAIQIINLILISTTIKLLLPLTILPRKNDINYEYFL